MPSPSLNRLASELQWQAELALPLIRLRSRANPGRQPRATESLPEGQSVNGDGISGTLFGRQATAARKRSP
jgi:hypothetical protein